MRYFFRVEYDGGFFFGWQSQAEGKTVQSEIEKAFETVLRTKIRITGAGRTDAGVHASAQGAHADLPEGTDIGRLVVSANAVLPQSIAVRDFTAVNPDFHARFSARERTYEYVMAFRKTPLFYKRAWVITYDVNWKLVEAQLSHLVGCHDFRAFCASNHGAKTTVCNVTRAEIRKKGDFRIFTISANRFLYRMVRSITGTLIDIGRGAITEPLDSIIKSGDRSLTGETAPAWGLTLTGVTYQEV
jgi:tRNA pseudouridine38-40 synthase